MSAPLEYQGSDGFVPTPGGPFSALTASMWPQDILSRLNNTVRDYSVQLKRQFFLA